MTGWFEDSYYIFIRSVDENGEIIDEEYDEMSLSDFEVVYGNITNHIVEVKVVLASDKGKDYIRTQEYEKDTSLRNKRDGTYGISEVDNHF